jgi:hypothetical protein
MATTNVSAPRTKKEAQGLSANSAKNQLRLKRF